MQRLEAKIRREKVRLNRVSNSQPPGHKSETLTTKPPGRGTIVRNGIISLLRMDSDHTTMLRIGINCPFCRRTHGLVH